MKKAVCLIALNSILMNTAFSKGLVVYGEDSRVEVYEATPLQQKLAKSTAAMVSMENIEVDPGNSEIAQLNQQTLSEWLAGDEKNISSEKSKNFGLSFCDGNRFVDQPNPSSCSGFLIAPDLLVTAGHCAEVEDMCATQRWVFDFVVDEKTKLAGVDVKTENIYSCKKIVSRPDKLSLFVGMDYAIIQLDRRVSDREPLDINNDLKISDGQELVVIGHPVGLPTKVASGAKVRSNEDKVFFSTNLDTFSGNSGSAVFNADTGVVEGILVRGEEDFEINFEKMCFATKVCKDDECRGEDVVRMTTIPEVRYQKELYRASTEGNIETLKKMLKESFWVDFYTKDGQSALIKAAAVAQVESMQQLIYKNANVNLQDAQGDTALHKLAAILTSTNVNALNVLMNAGAKLEIRNKDGETPLLRAGKELNFEAVKLLIAAGADKNAVDNNNENVLFTFARHGDKKIMRELALMGVEIKPAMKGAKRLKLSIKVKRILNELIKVSKKD